MPARALATTTRGRAKVVLELVVAEGRLAGVDADVDRAASTAITAVRTATGDVRLAPERRSACTAIARAQPQPHRVEKHPALSSHAARGAPIRGVGAISNSGAG